MKQENVLNYYILCSKLKDVVRTGWKEWNVKRERVESVAEHIYGVQMLALAMYYEFDYDIDIRKVIMMISVHEMEEILIGDLTQFEITKEEKNKIGHEAIVRVLSNLSNSEEIKNLILEFDDRKTKEALFAYQCDKLECDIQCKLYDKEGCVDLNNQDSNTVKNNRDVQKLMLESGMSWSDMWLTFDKERINFDDNFRSVIEYMMENTDER